MSSALPNASDAESARLERCIRDLAAVSAIPAMCIGRSQREAIDIVLEALPVALGWDLLLLELPGEGGERHARQGGFALGARDLERLDAELRRATEAGEIATSAGPRFVLSADFPVHGGVGRVVAGRSVRMSETTDRVLLRTTANIVGTTLDTARVLEEARRLDEFLAVLGHELRNPLAPIRAAVEVLERHPHAAKEVAIIDRSSRHLGRLVDDLLDISRITRGYVELERGVVPLGMVVEQAVGLVEPAARRAKHVMEVDDARDLHVDGDPVRLAQALGNVLSNAVKFTPPSGRIRVSIARAGGRVRIAIADTGRGIPPEELRRIFEPFVQIDRARDALRGGLGLGLAIAHDLVARHGGTLTASSEGLGHGTTFTFEFPLAASAERQAPPARPNVTGGGLRVLIVDDNVDLADLVSSALGSRGFEVRVAHDAAEALAAWGDFRPHAAILDLGLPGRDGFALARELRAAHGLGFALLAMTGYGQKRDAELARAAGFDRFLVKPVALGDVARALNDCVHERNQMVQASPTT